MHHTHMKELYNLVPVLAELRFNIRHEQLVLIDIIGETEHLSKHNLSIKRTNRNSAITHYIKEHFYFLLQLFNISVQHLRVYRDIKKIDIKAYNE
jgi:hypothetical protein